MGSSLEDRVRAPGSPPSAKARDEIRLSSPTAPIVSATLDPPLTILGIEPGSREIGLAVLFNGKLDSVGVYSLCNGHAPHDPVARAERILATALAQYHPQILAIRTPGPPCQMRRAIIDAFLQTIAQAPIQRAVHAMSFTEIGRAILGNPKATKLAVADALVAQGFEQLRSKLPKRPARSALGFRAGERYRFHAFIVLAVAVTAEKLHRDAGRSVRPDLGSPSTHGQSAS